MLNIRPKFLPWLVLASLFSSHLIAEEVNWRINRVLPLEKVTVGPTDNYQAVIATNNDFIYYTRHQNLLSSLVKQDLKTGISSYLLANDYDSKDPALSPDASQLAVTLFRYDALGDVCLLPLNEAKAKQSVNCLTKSNSREWQPFWVNNQQLGYLRKSLNQATTELVLHSLATNRQQVITQGQLSAPAASSDGQWLVYNREPTAKQEGGLFLYKLAEKKEYGPIQLDLPGNSSFATFDSQQAFIYFSHYLNDTNNDQQIDAQDHSVLFRLPLAKALDTSQKHLPEQLTSVAQNCSFPALTQNKVYMTCAFEGSLDTYRMPVTGQVPANWQVEDLHLAHAQASSYEERLLLLNTLRYRFKQTSVTRLESLLSNHLALNEYTAASYYINQLAESYQSQPDLSEFFNYLARLVDLQAKQRLQPQGMLTASYRQDLQTLEQQLNQPKVNPQNKALFTAWINYLANQPQAALRSLIQPQTNNLHPLQVYLQLELANQLLADNPQGLEKLWRRALTINKISSEARLFYAFQWLKQLNSPQLALTAAQQEKSLQQVAASSTDERVKILLLNELDLLKLIAASELDIERSHFTSISKRLAPAKDDAQLKRLSHLRAIQLTGLAEKYNFMELMSRHWLTHTSISDPGFAQTAEYYASINLSRAYGSLEQQEMLTALNSFYALVRQTSDPEAIYQLIYIGLMLDTNLKPRMELLLNQLKAEELIAKDDAVATSTLELLQNPQLPTQRLEELAKELQAYKAKGLNRGAADLLTGSIYHRLLLASQKGYQHNQSYYQQAHYHYMLGFDLAWNNQRTQAALLNNLGQLHLTVRNYGLASEFFLQRLQLPFINPEEQLLTHWQLAQSLFYSNRGLEASKQAEQALILSNTLGEQEQLVALEKAGFYALQAEDFNTAFKHYQALLATEQLSGVNLTKAQFNLAYLHYKLGNNASAYTGFQQVLQALPQLKARAFKPGELPGFSPERLTLQTYGFLAQLATQPEEKLQWLEKRLALLARLKIKDLRLGFDEEGRLSQLIQTQLQAAMLLEALNRPEQLASLMKDNLNNLVAWQKNGGSLIGQPVLHSVYNYLVFASLYPRAFAEEPQLLAEFIQNIDKEWLVEPETPAYNQAQQLKLKLLVSGYRFRLEEQSKDKLQTTLLNLEKSPSWELLATSRPDLHLELEKLAKGVLALAKP
ncbi:hypothetical protein [Marinospirillum insulare]|uniref:Tetratricopeptide repeat-containing protein n=1 Tax=Marinospirillum insulare TaxID=217169 RepID=A0ABQ6A506_9GAMM|nr:hypothetical protein [Marinospirillum insulare]GLR65180.1 hypothetical protein GCM10007878_26190 [Marinospirillum insulare]